MPLTQQTLRDYFSSEGSFSRKELLIAAVSLFAIGAALHTLQGQFPKVLPRESLKPLDGLLYVVWGAALGKRSRDLGTTFTYGMVVGMLVPVIGLVFLFQQGKKEKQQAQLRAALAAEKEAGQTVEP